MLYCIAIHKRRVKKYIDENKKRPSTHDNNNDIKILGNWIDTQLKNYTKKKRNNEKR